MSQTLKIKLPDNTPMAEAKAIQAELKEVEGIKNAGSLNSRGGIDPASVMAWIQVGTTVLSTASSFEPLVKKIGGIFNKRSMKGVTLEGPGGVKISLDKASSEDVQKLLEAISKK